MSLWKLQQWKILPLWHEWESRGIVPLLGQYKIIYINHWEIFLRTFFIVIGGVNFILLLLNEHFVKGSVSYLGVLVEPVNETQPLQSKTSLLYGPHKQTSKVKHLVLPRERSCYLLEDWRRMSEGVNKIFSLFTWQLTNWLIHFQELEACWEISFSKMVLDPSGFSVKYKRCFCQWRSVRRFFKTLR